MRPVHGAIFAVSKYRIAPFGGDAHASHGRDRPTAAIVREALGSQAGLPTRLSATCQEQELEGELGCVSGVWRSESTR
jgi:hypothetical protein